MDKVRLRRDRHGNLYVIEGNTVYPIDDKNHRYPLMTDKDGNLYFEDENGQIRLQKDKKSLFSNHSQAIAIIIAAIIGLLVVKDPVINAFCSAIGSENATIMCSQPTQPPIITPSPHPTETPIIVTVTPSEQFTTDTPTVTPDLPATATNVPTPISTPVVAQSVISSCPGYPNLPYWASGVARSRTEIVVIPGGQVAFIDTASVTTKEGAWSDGVFMTITGPYSGEITLYDGAFCGGISTTANYQPVMQQRLAAISSNFPNYQAISLP